jgi:chaperonin GroES
MSVKSIKPLGNRIVVEREEAKTSRGGILLPETAQEKPKLGKVVAVGPGNIDEQGKRIPIEIKVGEKILFSSYAGTEYKEQDREFLVLSEEDVLAILN